MATNTNPAINNIVYWKQAYENAKNAGKPASSLAYIDKQVQPLYAQLGGDDQSFLKSMNASEAANWYNQRKGVPATPGTPSSANTPTTADAPYDPYSGFLGNPFIQNLLGQINSYGQQQNAYAQAQAQAAQQQQQQALAAQQNQVNSLRNNYNTQLGQLQTSQNADLAAVDRNFDTAKQQVNDQSFQNYLTARQNVANRGLSGSGIEADQNTRLAMANGQAIAGLQNTVLNQKDQINANYGNQASSVRNNIANLLNVTPLESSGTTGGSGSAASGLVKPDDTQITASQKLLETLIPYMNATVKDQYDAQLTGQKNQMSYAIDNEKNRQNLIDLFGYDENGNVTLDTRKLAQTASSDSANQQLKLAELLGYLPDGTSTLASRTASDKSALDWSALMGVDPNGNPTFANTKFQNEYALDQWYKQNQIANTSRGLDIRQYSAEQGAAQGWEKVRIQQQNANTAISRLQLDADKFATSNTRNQFKDQTSQVSTLMKSAYTDMNNAMAAMNKYQADPNSAAYKNALNRYTQAQSQYDVAYQALDTLSQAGINAGAAVASGKKPTAAQQKQIDAALNQTFTNVNKLLDQATNGLPSNSFNFSQNSKATKFNDEISSAASRFNIDPALIKGIIEAESNFNPNAGSSAGAQGLMQLMPGTARGLGISNVYDPAQNIAGGTQYIAGQLKKYGNIELALAAYNWGPGNVDKAIKKYGKNWTAIKPFAPKETQAYVGKVVGNTAKYRQ